MQRSSSKHTGLKPLQLQVIMHVFSSCMSSVHQIILCTSDSHGLCQDWEHQKTLQTLNPKPYMANVVTTQLQQPGLPPERCLTG